MKIIHYYSLHSLGINASVDVLNDVQAEVAEKGNLGGVKYDMSSNIFKQFSEINPKLEEAIRRVNLSKYNKELLVVGHALGGAIANAAAVYYANKSRRAAGFKAGRSC